MVLKHCSAHLILEGLQGTDEIDELTDVSSPASSLECKCVCTAGAGGFRANYGVSQAQLRA